MVINRKVVALAAVFFSLSATSNANDPYKQLRMIREKNRNHMRAQEWSYQKFFRLSNAVGGFGYLIKNLIDAKSLTNQSAGLRKLWSGLSLGRDVLEPIGTLPTAIDAQTPYSTADQAVRAAASIYKLGADKGSFSHADKIQKYLKRIKKKDAELNKAQKIQYLLALATFGADIVNPFLASLVNQARRAHLAKSQRRLTQKALAADKSRRKKSKKA